MPLPPDLSLCELGLDELDSMLELVGCCDRTYREWAPPGWDVPDLELDRARWERDWGQAGRWARGAVEESGRLVGMVAWRSHRNERDRAVPGVAHLSALFVHPERWREGIGLALVENAEAAMRERGYRLAVLWTPEGAPARHFYEAIGWRVDGRRGWHEALQLPIVGYEKRLEGWALAFPAQAR
jgi:GNAT superfamily N-acetyltransferase